MSKSDLSSPGLGPANTSQTLSYSPLSRGDQHFHYPETVALRHSECSKSSQKFDGLPQKTRSNGEPNDFPQSTSFSQEAHLKAAPRYYQQKNFSSNLIRSSNNGSKMQTLQSSQSSLADQSQCTALDAAVDYSCAALPQDPREQTGANGRGQYTLYRPLSNIRHGSFSPIIEESEIMGMSQVISE